MLRHGDVLNFIFNHLLTIGLHSPLHLQAKILSLHLQCSSLLLVWWLRCARLPQVLRGILNKYSGPLRLLTAAYNNYILSDNRQLLFISIGCILNHMILEVLLLLSVCAKVSLLFSAIAIFVVQCIHLRLVILLWGDFVLFGDAEPNAGLVDGREWLAVGAPATCKFTLVVVVRQLFEQMRMTAVGILADLWGACNRDEHAMILSIEDAREHGRVRKCLRTRLSLFLST